METHEGDDGQRPVLTRRQLLLAVGAAGGAGALIGALGAMQLVDDDSGAPFRPPSRSDFTLNGRVNRTSVVVVGAGVAGLCCAYELGKAGYDVTVIDARRRIGGRCWTVRNGDEVVDTLEYDRRFWETDDQIFGGITHCDPSVRDIWYPSTGYFGDGGVVVGAYPFGQYAERFSRMAPAEREELAVSVGEAIHGPAYREELRSSFSVDWTTQEHSRAAWHGWTQFGVGYARLLRGEGRWWFAGDWLARTPGWQHGAFESARRAVTDLHTRVLEE